MSRLLKYAKFAYEKPMEVVEGIIAIAVFLVGSWYVSPFYKPSDSVTARIWESNSIPQYTGVFQMILSGLLLFALVRPKWNIRRKMRRWMTFSIFLLYMFYGFSSVMILGTGRVSWITTFALAFLMGVAHLRLKMEMGEENARN